jgi:hypothetical protein
MAFSVLSNDTRSKLEQERSRLIEQRDAIIQAVIKQATAEVDQALQQLDQLLGGDITTSAAAGTTHSKPAQSKSAARSTSKSAPSKTQTAPSKKNPAAPAPKTASKAKPAAPATRTSSKVRAKLATDTSKAPAKANAKSIGSASKSTPQPLALKRTFKSVTPTEAVKQILQQAGKPLTTDEVIQALYQSVKEADLSSARKSVALILGRGAYQGVYEKVQENPSRFQIKQ